MKKSDIIKYNLKFNHIDSKNPVTIGNGDFAITLDQTGTQSLYEIYKDIPLSTMSNKNWFYKDKKDIKPSYVDGKAYMLFNLDNDPNYQTNRQYPFKYSFMQILLYDNDKLIDINNIKDVKQELDLYKGIVTSSFNYKEKINKTISFIYQDHDEFNFKLQSDNLNLALKFNYPSYTKNGYRLDILPNVLVKEDRITLLYDDKNSLSFKLKSSSNYQIVENTLIFDDNNVSFSLALDEIKEGKLLDEFWKCDNGIIIIDNEELVKKMVLSKYLLHVNSTGIYPPQESGLTYNCWNSKFHLEMHLIHSLWNIYNNHVGDLVKSFDYYLSIMPSSLKRASLNGYKGLRFPKMTGPDGEDSPSNIGPLLIWQAPHILFMLQEIYYLYNKENIIKKYEPLISGTIDFMISFLTLKDSKYQMLDPLLEACESIPLDRCQNPSFELEYWRYTLERQPKIDTVLYGHQRYDYLDITSKIITPKEDDGIYLKTYGVIDKYDLYKDHPTEGFLMSFFKSKIVDKEKMVKTIDYILKNMDLSSYWGWDFPFLGLSLLNCGEIEKSIEVTQLNTINNQYLYNGYNTSPRDDLKAYLPGNGAFLIYYYYLSNILIASLK
ncbi:putative uncharacterized protein [Clostridium sp. CAG:307]|nr:putative uncharacterized protein [Clostridium sp. CAG:307]